MKIKKSKEDIKWSKLVRERDGSCRVCGKPASQYKLDAHHIMPRSRNATRLDVSNGLTLCVHHHTFGDYSVHKVGKQFVIDLIGLKEYKRLEKLSLSGMSKAESIKQFNQKYVR